MNKDDPDKDTNYEGTFCSYLIPFFFELVTFRGQFKYHF